MVTEDPGDEEERSSATARSTWPLLRRTLGLLAPYKKHYCSGIVLGVSQTMLEMLSPKFTQWIINYGDRLSHRASCRATATRQARDPAHADADRDRGR